MLALGFPVAFTFSKNQGILYGIFLGVPEAILIYILTSSAKNSDVLADNIKKLVMKLAPNMDIKESMPRAVSILNFIVVFVFYAIGASMIAGFFNISQMGNAVVKGGLIGIWAFYYTAPQPWEAVQYKYPEMLAEALKLEHDSLWRMIDMLCWISLTAIIALIVAPWSEIIYPMVPMERRSDPVFVTLLAFNLAQLFYFLIGFWIGVIREFMDRAWRIEKKIASLELKALKKK